MQQPNRRLKIQYNYCTLNKGHIKLGFGVGAGVGRGWPGLGLCACLCFVTEFR